MHEACFSWRDIISHRKLWAYKIAGLGLMPAVENFHFKAFPDQFVGLVLY